MIICVPKQNKIQFTQFYASFVNINNQCLIHYNGGGQVLPLWMPTDPRCMEMESLWGAIRRGEG